MQQRARAVEREAVRNDPDGDVPPVRTWDFRCGVGEEDKLGERVSDQPSQMMISCPEKVACRPIVTSHRVGLVVSA